MLSIMRRLFFISFPLSTIALFVLTAKGEMTFLDGPNETVIGFPFIWAMDGVNSMSLEIALISLIGNFLIYLFITCLVFVPISKHVKKYKMIGIMLWSINILVCIIVGIWVFIDPDFSLLFKFPEESELINYHFTFFGFFKECYNGNPDISLFITGMCHPGLTIDNPIQRANHAKEVSGRQ